ncbi:helix-turn-helix transcriptional regulator [Myroides sp. NP-2]|uniref:helix-turn-helix transcriptional regulator n=1 Tax=Myroides sp. NP-2 TaxID=2759945 RepID=UPI0015FC59EE|nr:helix-turn-helix transcriptional regulator [Myroides sp. NP-2]MBB1149796.1 helix-turn-helix transcriptional regulator [Myroides sp. NP-2]
MSNQHDHTEKRQEGLDLPSIEIIQALTSMTYKSIYILNHEKRKFEYISDNPIFLAGHSVQEVHAMGFDFYTRCVPEKEQELLGQVCKVGFAFFNTLSAEYKKDYTLSCDFHLIHQHIPNLLIRQEITPLQLSSTGRLSKSICMASLSTAQEAGNIAVYTKTRTHCWKFNAQQQCWELEKSPCFTPKELSVLYASIQGFTVQEIADLLYLAPDTIKFHRRKIMEKCQVNTLAQAIRYVIVNKLL